MTTVNYTEYKHDRDMFFKKHKYDYKLNTSSMDEYGRYTKTYSFADNAQWIECMSPVWVKETAEVKMCKINVEVKMFRTEYWSTDNASSKCYYEKF